MKIGSQPRKSTIDIHNRPRKSTIEIQNRNQECIVVMRGGQGRKGGRRGGGKGGNARQVARVGFGYRLPAYGRPRKARARSSQPAASCLTFVQVAHTAQGPPLRLAGSLASTLGSASALGYSRVVAHPWAFGRPSVGAAWGLRGPPSLRASLRLLAPLAWAGRVHAPYGGGSYLAHLVRNTARRPPAEPAAWPLRGAGGRNSLRSLRSLSFPHPPGRSTPPPPPPPRAPFPSASRAGSPPLAAIHGALTAAPSPAPHHAPVLCGREESEPTNSRSPHGRVSGGRLAPHRPAAPRRLRSCPPSRVHGGAACAAGSAGGRRAVLPCCGCRGLRARCGCVSRHCALASTPPFGLHRPCSLARCGLTIYDVRL